MTDLPARIENGKATNEDVLLACGLPQEKRDTDYWKYRFTLPKERGGERGHYWLPNAFPLDSVDDALKLIPEGRAFELKLPGQLPAPASWRVMLYATHDTNLIHTGQSDTLARAISAAVVRAHEKDQGDG